MTTDQPAYRMIIEQGRLVPAGPVDQERLMAFEDGTEIECGMKPTRNGTLIRKLYGVLGLVIKQCDTPWKKADEAVQALKDSLGLAETGIGLHGQDFRFLRSLNDLSEYELTEFMDGCWLWLRKITGVDPLTLVKPEGNTPHAARPDAHQDKPGGGLGGALPSAATNSPEPEQEIDAAKGPSAAGESQPAGDVASAAGAEMNDPTVPAPADIDASKREMITKLFRLAAEPISVDEKLAIMVDAHKAWEATLPGHMKLVATVFDTITKVVRGQLPADAARKFISQL
jgi:hypothetical protein